MSRSFTLADLVSLPVVDAYRMLNLCTQLIASARALLGRGEVVPEGLVRSLARLESAHQALFATLSASPGAAPPDTKGADQDLDHAWGSLHAVIRGYADMPAKSAAAAALKADAQALLALLFPTGLAFLKEDYLTEHAQSGAKLALLAAEERAPVLHRLGLGPMLLNLNAAQEAYGAALGLTAPITPPPSPQVREKLDALRHASRDFLVRAVAVNDPEIPGSAELSAALLQPATTWE